MKILLTSDTKVGRCNELVEMSDLKAKLLLLRKKAILPSQKGCILGQIQWGEFGEVVSMKKIFSRKAGLPIVSYEARPLNRNGLFKYILGDNNELCVKHLSSDKIYHLDSTKNRLSGLSLGHVVVMSKNLAMVLNKFPHLLEQGMTDNTYLTSEQICDLENRINNEYDFNVKENICK